MCCGWEMLWNIVYVAEHKWRELCNITSCSILIALGGKTTFIAASLLWFLYIYEYKEVADPFHGKIEGALYRAGLWRNLYNGSHTYSDSSRDRLPATILFPSGRPRWCLAFSIFTRLGEFCRYATRCDTYIHNIYMLRRTWTQKKFHWYFSRIEWRSIPWSQMHFPTFGWHVISVEFNARFFFLPFARPFRFKNILHFRNYL